MKYVECTDLTDYAVMIICHQSRYDFFFSFVIEARFYFSVLTIGWLHSIYDTSDLHES